MTFLDQPGGVQRSQTKFLVFENFEKLDTNSSRLGLSEKSLSFIENLQFVGPNKLITVPASAVAAFASIGETAILGFFASIGGVDYIFVFTSAGAGFFINLSTAAVGQFAPDGTFSNTPDLTVWQASRVLINDPVAGYCTFDGSLFVQLGGVSPNITVTNGGAGYSPGSPPSVTISGGSGTGATAVAIVNSAGQVIGVKLTNPGTGYQPGDTLTVTFGTSPGSGAAGHVTMTGFPVTNVLVNNGGRFQVPAAVGPHALTFSGGGGTGAAGYANVVNVSGNINTIANCVVTDPGSGYTSAPAVSLSVSSVAILPSLSAVLGTESVASIVLDAGGTGYGAPPAVTITPSNGVGGGAAAVTTLAATAVNTLTLTASAVTTLTIAVHGVSTSPPGTYNLNFSAGAATGTCVIGTYTDNTGNPAVGVVSVNLTSGGAAYTTPPTVTVVGAVFTSNPTILALIASQGAGYTLTPAVLIGAGTGATASAHVWPSVPKGNTLAVFQGRVWLNGLNTVSNQYNILQWTGTGANVNYGNVAYDDFLAGDASGSLLITDADLVHAITALRSLNNYLFIMGDQSVKQIGNISLNASGNVTLFTILTISSDQGTIYPQSCISFNRTFLFANQNGIYGVVGSSVQKLSSDIDGIWSLASLASNPQQGAVFDLNAIHYALYTIRYLDPNLGARQILVAFDGRRWQVWSQTGLGASIVTWPSLATGALSLFSLAGQNIQQLFTRPTTPVKFTIQTALSHHGNAAQGKRVVRAGFTGNSNFTNTNAAMTLDTEGGIGGTILAFTLPPLTPTPELVGGAIDDTTPPPPQPVSAAGIYLGATISATAAGAQISNIILEYQETSLWKGA